MKTYTPDEVVEFLDTHGIGVVFDKGKPNFVRPPGMSKEDYLDLIAQVGKSAAEHREYVIHVFAKWRGRGKPGYAEQRRQATRSLVELRGAMPLWNLYWFSRFDASAGRLRDEETAFPTHATDAACLPPYSSYRGQWAYLPWASPPKGWQAPVDWVPYPKWHKPDGWQPTRKTQAQVRKEWNERWKRIPESFRNIHS